MFEIPDGMNYTEFMVWDFVPGNISADCGVLSIRLISGEKCK